MIVLVPIIAGLVVGVAMASSNTRIVFGIKDPIAPPGYPPLATIVPRRGKSSQRIVRLSNTMSSVWNDVTGLSTPMPSQAKVLAAAQAAAEGTGYGQGWEMVGNVGSYHCKSGSSGTSYYDCVPHKDSKPDPKGGPNVEYTEFFRSYKDGPGRDGKLRDAFENGVYDFVHSITFQFPALKQLLDGDLLGYCLQQYKNGYYQAFNLSEDGYDAYAPSIEYLLDIGVPIKPKGVTEKIVAGRVAFYAAAMARNIPEIVDAIGPAPVLVPKDLTQPWNPKFQASSGVNGVSGLSWTYFAIVNGGTVVEAAKEVPDSVVVATDQLVKAGWFLRVDKVKPAWAPGLIWRDSGEGLVVVYG